MVVLLICHNWFYWALFIINYEKYLQRFILQQIMFNFFFHFIDTFRTAYHIS